MATAATIPRSPFTGTSLSLEEFDAFCRRDDNADRSFELVNGEVVEMPRPNRRHGTLQATLIRHLGNYAAEQTPPGEVTSETGVIIRREPATVRGPDVAYFLTVPDEADNDWDGWYRSPPFLAVEIISPNDRQRDILNKINEYFRIGVMYVWVVNPEEQFVAVYRGDMTPVPFGVGQSLTCPELPGFELPLATLFSVPA